MLNFKGVFTALVTPFHETEEVDFESYKNLLAHQLKGDISGVVVSGTTGESPNLSEDEFEKLVLIAKETLINTNKPLIVGTGTNSTKETLKKSKKAKALGADALLVVTPYYNKPTQEGLFKHFGAVAAEVAPLPVILYDVPGRTGVKIEVETVKRLAATFKNIIGIKDATGDLGRIPAFKSEIGQNFLVLSGDDPLFLPSLAVGADGIISVASNFIPKTMMGLYRERRKEEHERLLPFFNGIFMESNPIPIKFLLKENKIIGSDTLRSPLVTMTQANRIKLQEIVAKGKIYGH